MYSLGELRPCPSCGATVLSADTDDIGLRWDLNPEPVPIAPTWDARWSALCWRWHNERVGYCTVVFGRTTGPVYVAHPCGISSKRKGTRMTAPQFETFVPPVIEDGDTFKPHEHIGAVLIVKVRERKPSVVTPNTPEGGPAVIVDTVDLTDGKLYQNVLWMGGAFVDALSPYVGKGPLVLSVESKVGKSGRSYASPLTATEANIELAQQFYAKKGDPFVQTFATPAPADDNSPPW